jgi:hypothetical protein
MYPYVMTAYHHPLRPLWKGKNIAPERLAKWLELYWVLADVEVETNEPAYGVPHKGRLVFPVGRFRAVLCDSELRYAIAHGHIKRVYRYVIYLPGHPFREYVDYFYRLRQEAKEKGNAILERNAKLMLNGLYGKFGERGRKTSVIATDPNLGWGYEILDSEDEGKSAMVWKLGNVALEVQKEGVAFFAFPALAASITAAARMYLWQIIKAAGAGHVYYCDTDSVIVSPQGLARLSHLIDPQELGKLKLEGEEDYIEIRGCKNYLFGQDARTAGLGKIVGRSDDGTLWVAKWLGLRSALRGGWLGEVRLRFYPWRPQGEYVKGKVGKDGWVRPLRFRRPLRPALSPLLGALLSTLKRRLIMGLAHPLAKLGHALNHKPHAGDGVLKRQVGVATHFLHHPVDVWEKFLGKLLLLIHRRIGSPSDTGDPLI